jgi:putative flippase GtrA
MRHHVKKTATWVWNERGRMSKYVVSGISALVADMGVYALITRGFGGHVIMANIFSVLCGAATAFTLNKFWSFNERSNTLRQSRRFIILFVANYVFSQVAFFIFAGKLHLYDMGVKVSIVALSTSWNFLLYKYWVYVVEA